MFNLCSCQEDGVCCIFFDCSDSALRPLPLFRLPRICPFIIIRVLSRRTPLSDLFITHA